MFFDFFVYLLAMVKLKLFKGHHVFSHHAAANNTVSNVGKPKDSRTFLTDVLYKCMHDWHCFFFVVSRIGTIKSDFFWATSIPERRLRESQPKVIRGDQSKRFFLTLNCRMAMDCSEQKKSFSQSQKAKHGLSCFLSSRCYVSWSWLPFFFLFLSGRSLIE